uniref:Uncharacterized protein n=1 Tax=Oryza rufipogon TaxID=4529 RepID=A0A0E0MXQ8_ORYRU
MAAGDRFPTLCGIFPDVFRLQQQLRDVYSSGQPNIASNNGGGGISTGTFFCMTSEGEAQRKLLFIWFKDIHFSGSGRTQIQQFPTLVNLNASLFRDVYVATICLIKRSQ